MLLLSVRFVLLCSQRCTNHDPRVHCLPLFGIVFSVSLPSPRAPLTRSVTPRIRQFVSKTQNQNGCLCGCGRRLSFSLSESFSLSCVVNQTPLPFSLKPLFHPAHGTVMMMALNFCSLSVRGLGWVRFVMPKLVSLCTLARDGALLFVSCAATITIPPHVARKKGKGKGGSSLSLSFRNQNVSTLTRRAVGRTRGRQQLVSHSPPAPASAATTHALDRPLKS